jgi:hypothetical protein
VTQHDVETIRRKHCGAFVRPFHCGHGCTGKIIEQSGRVQLARGTHPVEIDVSKREASLILMDDDKRRAADGGRLCAQTLGNSAYQRCLPCSEGTIECDGFSSSKISANGLA